MMLKSTADTYGAVGVTIHWLTAVLIIIALASGLQADNAGDPAAQAMFLRLHIPVAIIVLLLTVFRIVWWWRFDSKPLPLAGSPAWQEGLARAVHIGFYVIILGMVASGIGIIVLSGAGPVLFGGASAPLPDFQQYAPRMPHGLGARLLIALLIAHVGAALYHHFIRRDGLIRRMWY